MAVWVPVIALLEPAGLDSVNGLYWLFFLLDEEAPCAGVIRRGIARLARIKIGLKPLYEVCNEKRDEAGRRFHH